MGLRNRSDLMMKVAEEAEGEAEKMKQASKTIEDANKRIKKELLEKEVLVDELMETMKKAIKKADEETEAAAKAMKLGDDTLEKAMKMMDDSIRIAQRGNDALEKAVKARKEMLDRGLEPFELSI